MKKPNKFDSLDREELLRRCLEQEDELEKLRPSPPKFKLGQLLASPSKNAYGWQGQPASYFIALSVENRMGRWFYGYAKHSSPGAFHAFPEDKLRAITPEELNGLEAPVVAPAGPMVQGVTNNSLTPVPAPIYPNLSSDF